MPSSYLIEESQKLASIRDALWSAFLAAPEHGIPSALVELASAYASTLRLQLTLMGMAAAPIRPPKEMRPHQQPATRKPQNDGSA